MLKYMDIDIENILNESINIFKDKNYSNLSNDIITDINNSQLFYNNKEIINNFCFKQIKNNIELLKVEKLEFNSNEVLKYTYKFSFNDNNFLLQLMELSTEENTDKLIMNDNIIISNLSVLFFKTQSLLYNIFSFVVEPNIVNSIFNLKFKNYGFIQIKEYNYDLITIYDYFELNTFTELMFINIFKQLDEVFTIIKHKYPNFSYNNLNINIIKGYIDNGFKLKLSDFDFSNLYTTDNTDFINFFNSVKFYLISKNINVSNKFKTFLTNYTNNSVNFTDIYNLDFTDNLDDNLSITFNTINNISVEPDVEPDVEPEMIGGKVLTDSLNELIKKIEDEEEFYYEPNITNHGGIEKIEKLENPEKVINELNINNIDNVNNVISNILSINYDDIISLENEIKNILDLYNKVIYKILSKISENNLLPFDNTNMNTLINELITTFTKYINTYLQANENSLISIIKELVNKNYKKILEKQEKYINSSVVLENKDINKHIYKIYKEYKNKQTEKLVNYRKMENLYEIHEKYIMIAIISNKYIQTNNIKNVINDDINEIVKIINIEFEKNKIILPIKLSSLLKVIILSIKNKNKFLYSLVELLNKPLHYLLNNDKYKNLYKEYSNMNNKFVSINIDNNVFKDIKNNLTIDKHYGLFITDIEYKNTNFSANKINLSNYLTKVKMYLNTIKISINLNKYNIINYVQYLSYYKNSYLTELYKKNVKYEYLYNINIKNKQYEILDKTPVEYDINKYNYIDSINNDKNVINVKLFI